MMDVALFRGNMLGLLAVREKETETMTAAEMIAEDNRRLCEKAAEQQRRR